ncbi:MAG TPA: hypothetical protein VNE62_13060 [Actinomycetota bacterium]|nr:hypothetical protein [Actinomycetota bacterium]
MTRRLVVAALLCCSMLCGPGAALAQDADPTPSARISETPQPRSDTPQPRSDTPRPVPQRTAEPQRDVDTDDGPAAVVDDDDDPPIGLLILFVIIVALGIALLVGRNLRRPPGDPRGPL